MKHTTMKHTTMKQTTMKHTTIKQTLTTLCILITLTLSAQVIDRFPHVESFEGSGNYSWGPVCQEGTNCGFPGRFTIKSDLIENKDGDQYTASHHYNENKFIITSPIYNLSCLADGEISFYYACSRNRDLHLYISLDGGSTWSSSSIWDNGTNRSTTSLSFESFNLSNYIGNENVKFRFEADDESLLDKIKVGIPGNTINLNYGYDLAGNRSSGTLTVSLQNQNSIVENRAEESDSNNNYTITELNVFPNPTSDKIFINTTISELGFISIYDETGALLSNRNFQSNHTVDFSAYNNGIYFIHITHNLDGERSVYKIIKTD